MVSAEKQPLRHVDAEGSEVVEVRFGLAHKVWQCSQSGRQVYSSQDIQVTRILPQAIKLGRHFDSPQKGAALSVCFVQPGERFILVVETRIYFRDLDCSIRIWLCLQLFYDLQGVILFSRHRIKVAQFKI